MDRDLQIWLIVFVAATAITAMVQMVAIVALCYTVWRLHAKVKEIERSVLREYHATAREVGEALRRSAKSAVEVSERIKGVTNEAVEVSQKRLGQADQLLDHMLNRVERISDSLEASVASRSGKPRRSQLACAPRWGCFRHQMLVA